MSVRAGQKVIFQGRPSTVLRVQGDIIAVSNYAGAWLIGINNPNLILDPCFICGKVPHEPTPEHQFWPTSEAHREAEDYDRKVVAAGGPTYPSMTAVETLDPREAVI